MTRLRYNNQGGNLGAGLSNSGTTITFAVAPGFATLASPDYIPIELEPGFGTVPNPNFEVIYLTGYTAGATTGTVQRGMENTSPIAHSNGVSWAHAPSALDIGTLQAPVAARATCATPPTTTGSIQKIPVDTLVYDTGNNMDVTTNHRFNCPVAGYYEVTATMYAGGISNSQFLYLSLYKNGLAYTNYAGGSGGSGGPAYSISDVIKCNAGDYLEFFAEATSGGGAAFGSTNNFTVCLISPSTPPSAIVNVARAYRNAALSVSANTWTKVPLDTVSFDPQGNMDIVTNHRYNIPVAGWYQVEGQVTTGANGTNGYTYVGLRKNGTEFCQGQAFTQGGNANAAVSDTVQCNAGDYIELYVYTDLTSLVVGNTGLNFLTATQVIAPQYSGNANALPYNAAYQSGVINGGDLALSSISLNTSTGAITATNAGAQQAIVKDASSSGLLVPVALMAIVGQVFTPGSLPAASNYAVYGVEVDNNGLYYLVKGADTTTQLNTGLLIAANAPATTAGRMRIADFALWNNAGTINFSDHTTTATKGTNYIDRRPWARGAKWINYSGTAGPKTMATNSFQSIDNTVLQARLECSGVPLKIKFFGTHFRSGGSSGDEFILACSVDGNVAVGGTSNPNNNSQVIVYPFSGTFWDAGSIYEWMTTPTPGSHLFNIMSWSAQGTINYGSGTPYGYGIEYEEVLSANTNNGIA